MVELKIGWIEVLRAITASSIILLFAVAPVLPPLISPLELLSIIFGTKNIPVSLIVPGLTVILIIVLFGRFFCGWICPVGMLLDCSHLFTERKERKGVGGLWKNRDKYVILLTVLSASLIFNFTAPHLFSPPRIVYRTIIYFTLQGLVGADLTVLLLIFILDFFAISYGRTWCNTLCPLGTVISSLSIVNLVKPKVDQERCIDFDFNCLNCERICPMRVPLTRADNWAIMDCNKCLKCWANCPVEAIKIHVLG